MNNLGLLHIARIIKVVVLPEGDPIFSERVTLIEIQDEAAGEYVTVTQEGESTEISKSIAFDRREWERINKCARFEWDRILEFIDL